MKKLALLAAGLLALGMGVFMACTDNVDTGDNGGDPNTPPDGGDPVTPVPDPEPDYSEQLGAYDDQLWLSSDGVLDLADGTFDGVDSFEITGVTGSNASIVISCTADEVDYNISLNDSGALEMRTAEGSELVRTFLADASAFAGAWYSEDNTSYYYVISSAVDEEGYFGWKMCSAASNVNPGDPYRAVTMFEAYDDGNAGMMFYVIDAGYYYYYSSETVYMSDGSSMGSSQVQAFTGIFEDTYVNNAGEELTIDMQNNTVVFQGNELSAGSGYGLLGAGIWFTSGSLEYALVYTNECVYLKSSDNTTEVYAAYDDEWLSGTEEGAGEWSIGTNTNNTASFTDDQSVVFNGTEYDLTRYIDDGDLVYSFVVPVTQGGSTTSYTYVIRPVEGTTDVFMMEGGISSRAGYYFRNSAKQQFVQTYTSNSQILEVDEDYYVTVTSRNLSGNTVSDYRGEFTYLTDLGSIVLRYSAPSMTGVSATYNLAMISTEGIYWTIVGSGNGYAVESTYFTEEYLPTAVAAFSQTLENSDDYFTTGGENPHTLLFDFDSGIVTVDGDDQKRFYFSWGYGAIRSDTEYDLYITVSEGEMVINNTYNRYTLFPSNAGLDAICDVVSIDAAGSITYSDETSRFYASRSTLEELFGLEFVYDGTYGQSSIYIDEEGDLYLSSYDTSSDSTDLIKWDKTDYNVHIALDENSEVITLVYSVGDQNYTITITDRLYAEYNSLVYSIPDLAEVVGTYSDGGNGYVTLSADGSLSINGSAVNVTNITSAPDQVVVTYVRNGVSYTAVFTTGSVTVNDVEYDKVDVNLQAFIGTYGVGVDGETIYIGITSAAGSVNEQITLVATVNGVIRTPYIQFSAGKLQLYFTSFDLSLGGTVRCTMTLDGDEVTVDVTVGGQTGHVKVAATEVDYGKFVVEDQSTSCGELTCIVKDGAPLFMLDGVLCDNYAVSDDKNGTQTLTLTFGDEVISINYADGEASLAGNAE